MVDLRTVELREYETLDGVELSADELSSVRVLFQNALKVSPSWGQPGRFQLEADSVIGAADLGSLQVHIQPKIGITRLFFLLSYALDPRQWRELKASFEVTSGVFEAVIPGYIAQVHRALARGPLRGYRQEESALQGIKGRLRFDDQLRYRFGRFPPAEVRYDEFDEDILENRLIKAALARLGRLRVRSLAARTLLRRFDTTLLSVTLEHYDPRDIPNVHYTRLNEHYRAALSLSRLVLTSSSFDARPGGIHTSSFLLDMNQVFEDFVLVALREALGASAVSLPQGAEGHPMYLDFAHRIRLKPDISWWIGNKCLFVGDVKYKDFASRGARGPDIYQVLAYATAAQLSYCVLIYGSQEPQTTHFVVEANQTKLEVFSIGLTQEPEQILHQFIDVADRIRSVVGSRSAAEAS